MLRIAIFRRGLIEDTGVDDPRVAEAIAVSSRVLREIRGMTTIDMAKTPNPPLPPVSCRSLKQEPTSLLSLESLSLWQV